MAASRIDLTAPAPCPSGIFRQCLLLLGVLAMAFCAWTRPADALPGGTWLIDGAGARQVDYPYQAWADAARAAAPRTLVIDHDGARWVTWQAVPARHAVPASRVLQASHAPGDPPVVPRKVKQPASKPGPAGPAREGLQQGSPQNTTLVIDHEGARWMSWDASDARARAPSPRSPVVIDELAPPQEGLPGVTTDLDHSAGSGLAADRKATVQPSMDMPQGIASTGIDTGRLNELVLRLLYQSKQPPSPGGAGDAAGGLVSQERGAVNRPVLTPAPSSPPAAAAEEIESPSDRAGETNAQPGASRFATPSGGDPPAGDDPDRAHLVFLPGSAALEARHRSTLAALAPEIFRRSARTSVMGMVKTHQHEAAGTAAPASGVYPDMSETGFRLAENRAEEVARELAFQGVPWDSIEVSVRAGANDEVIVSLLNSASP